MSNSRRTTSRDSVTISDRLDIVCRKLDNFATKEFLNSVIANMKEELQTQIHRENEELVNSLKGRINSLETENEELKDKLCLLEQRQADSDEIISDLEERYNDLEQHGRKNSIRINGLQDNSDKESVEECVKKVVELVNTKLNVPLQPHDIDIAHRLGKFDNARKRSIIVKFTHRRKKHEITRSRRKLKGSGITIFEDLTKTNQQRLKDAFKVDCVQNSYSVDGKLYVILKNGKKRRLFPDTKLTNQFLENDANFNYRRI
ncbi:protein unc-13 homolog C-like [Argopecten irradians]|uniref:protein unc-13 homolog C-like n=1 Tax=Argopecten irradians TaxID=31199 RepID=UPI0037247C9D